MHPIARIAAGLLLPCIALAGPGPAYLPPQRVGPAVTGDGAIADRFGLALVHEGTTLVVGGRQVVVPAQDSAVGWKSGAVFVYTDSGTAFVAGPRLLPPQPAEDDLFGEAIALSGDLMVVGAPGTDGDEMPNRGAAHVFRRQGAAWNLEATLSIGDGAAEDRFGQSVAIGGDVAWIGAPGRAAEQGVVVGFRRVAGVWTETSRVQAASPLAGERFGAALAADASLLLVGVPFADAASVVDAGAVDRFDTSAAPGTAVRLGAAAPSALARFGSALWAGASSVFVGAPGDLSSVPGRVHAYVRSGATLVGDGSFVASDTAPADGFGSSLDFDGAQLLVGAPARLVGIGGGYVFTRVGGLWTQQARLEDSSAPEGGGLTGGSAALVGGRALLGADLATALPNRSQGLVRVWRGAASSWMPEARIDRGDGAAGEVFGFAVAVDGPRAAVGSFLDDTPDGGDDAGSVTLFDRTDAGWVRGARITAPDGEPEDFFGRAVALDGDLLVAGAPRDILDTGVGARGSAWVFRRGTSGAWTAIARLVAPDAQPDDAFGLAVAVQGDRIVVAAPGRDDGGTNRGGAYGWTVFDDDSLRYDGKVLPSSVPDFAFAGIGLSLDADRVALGAPGARIGNRSGQGMIALFRFSGAAWVEAGSVIAADGAAGDNFGDIVAFEPGAARLAVGAPGVSLDEKNTGIGAAYVFRLEGAPVQETRLQAPLPQALAEFGATLAIRDGRLLVAAPSEDVGGQADFGRVYRFERIAGAWQAAGTVDPVDATPFTGFGRGLAIDSGSAVIGGPQRASVGPAEGSAWFFADADALLRDGFD